MKAKSLVSADLHFREPFVETTDKEAFFKSAAPLAQIAKRRRLLRRWADEDVSSISMTRRGTA